MLSRRKFFQLSSDATVVGLNLSSWAEPSRPVPPAIASLPDLSSQARPFTKEERLARVERAKELMGVHKMDAILLANHSASAEYFANVRLDGSERLWALAMPAKGRPFLVCPAFEEDRAREILAAGPFGRKAEILTWQEDEDPFALTVQGLRDRGATGVIGLDENMKFIFASSLQKAGPQMQWTSAVPVTAGCRMIKSQHELECMRLACRATLLVYRAVYQSLQPGMTTRDVEKLIEMAYQRVGFRGEASLNLGEYTALPHGSEEVQTIREGTILMLDDGCMVEGYWSDITRTFVLGKPTDKMLRIFEIVHSAQSTALATAKPGVPAAEVDAAARKVIVDAGYGPGFKSFTHRLGHGIGLEMHEWPYFVKNNMFGWEREPMLQPGMVLSDEPGIYLPGEFGIRLEDDLHVTENGAELLTPQSPSLQDPFGGFAG
ncbi:M24 family metallopeptidase [Pseudacidobacterium ailaaui]|uniref:M24 family metallopeptidase n=1 Tax=Pseudacidobacterium ailaaui TaxID=1382359 RepID=UPI00047DFE80|nr:Xaa-Pro peptidase family protein [Pseudacidobacterium ailaaui]